MSHSTTLYGEQKRRPRRQICPMPAPAVRFCSIKHSIRSRHALKFCQVVVFPRAKPPVEANLDRVKVLTVGGQAERYRCRSKSLDGSNQGHVSCGVPYSCVFVGCHLRRKIFEFAVSHDPHNPKVGGSNPPPATNSINHLAGFHRFHLGQIRVTNSSYCTEVVIVGQLAHRSFSGFQPSSSACCFTNSTKRR
jgi:hypothetical protein